MSPIKKLLKPDTNEVLFYLGLGLVFLFINNLLKLWDYTVTDSTYKDVSTYNDLALVVQDRLTQAESSIDPRFADFTVWVIVGLLALLTVFLAHKVLGESSSDLKRATILRKTRYSRVVTREVIYRLGLRISGLLLLIIWFRIYFGSLFSRTSDLFLESILNIFSIQVLYLPIAIIFTALGLYIFAICIRLITLKIRVFN